MSQVNKIYFMVLLTFTFSCTRQNIYRSGYNYPQGNMNMQLFYDQLSPYGQWTSYHEHGYVWIPKAENNFFPYATNGHWIMTEYGWTWLSDYPWGWAAFHYGRWDYDYYLGWFWVPGGEWGPSWVTWRRANGYYGWTPMRPGMNVNLSITGGSRDVDRWVFISERDIGRPNIRRRYVNRRNNESIFRNSTIINNTYIDSDRNVTYVSGPRPEEVSRVTGRTIARLPVQDQEQPGEEVSSSRLHIYRPHIRKSNAKGERAEPSIVAEPHEINSSRETNSVKSRLIKKQSDRQEQQDHQINRGQYKEKEVRRDSTPRSGKPKKEREKVR